MLRSRSNSLLPVTNGVHKSDSFSRLQGGPLSARRRKGTAGACLRVVMFLLFASVLLGAGYTIAKYGPVTSTQDLEGHIGGLTAEVHPQTDGRVLPKKNDSASRHQDAEMEVDSNSYQLKEEHNHNTDVQQQHLSDEVHHHEETVATHTQKPSDIQHEPAQAQHVEEHSLPSAYNDAFSAFDIHGNPYHMSHLKGHVALVVNVASQCGYTDANYQGLQQIYERYHNYGLEVIAFPSNQFGNQEPGTNEEIEAFVTGRYGAAFALMAKVDVNGPQEHPLFTFLKQYTPALPDHQGNEDVSWNFNKFLIDKWGRPLKRFGPELVYHDLEADIYTQLVKPYP